jgi:hypothetical protein
MGSPSRRRVSATHFHDAARAAGVNKSAHGVRKIAAIRAAENGATERQLNAIFGWCGPHMAVLYTREAERKRLAKEAIDTLTRTSVELSMVAPKGKVRPRGRKTS